MAREHPITAKIRAHDSGLDPERLSLKYAAMKRDAFAFFRGTCHLFYDRLPPIGALRRAPPAWCCGDLHLENFGSFKGDNGLVYFDLNDFDEAILAPCVWDLIRLAASVALARGMLGIATAEVGRLRAELIDAYAEALARGKAQWLERDTAHGTIGAVLATLRGRSRKELLDRRTAISHGQRRIVIDHVHALAATEEDRTLVRKLIRRFARKQPNPNDLTPIDVARRIAGTGSLGLARYIILVAGNGDADRLHLLDLKQARRSSSDKRVGLTQPRWRSQAERVIAVQTRCQAVSPAFLAPIEAKDRSFVLRELQPIEDRLDLVRLGRDLDGLTAAIRCMGSLCAWDQLRAAGRQGSAIADDLIAFAAETKWRRLVLRVADEAAEQAFADWEVYAREFVDDGALGRS